MLVFPATNPGIAAQTSVALAAYTVGKPIGFRCGAVSGATGCACGSISIGNGRAIVHKSGDVLFDSVAQYSGVQGADGWFYGYYSGTYAPSGFAAFTIFDAAASQWYTAHGSGGFHTFLDAVGGLPNGPNSVDGRRSDLQWAVRRWISDMEGTVTISGRMAKVAGYTSGDGFICRITVDGTEILEEPIAANNVAGLNFTRTVAMHAGSIIDFSVDPKASNNFDHAVFTVRGTVQ